MPTSSAPAAQTPTTDELVLQLFAKVKQKQSEVTAASEKPRWETSCTVGENPGSVTDRINLQTTTDVSTLVGLYGFLIAKERQWNEAASALNVDTQFKWMGSPVRAWHKDIKTRIAQIEVAAKRQELKTLETRLDGLITVDQRRALELAEIQKILA